MSEESTIGPIEPNPVGSVLSAGALKAKALADKLRISYTGPGANPEGSEMGAGELLFGRGPEALEQWAYGFPPWTGKGQTLRLKSEAIEIAALPTFGALGMSKAVAKGVAKAAPRILKKTLPSPVDLERRNFLKHAGAAVALTAAPTALIKGIEHAAPRAAAKATVRAAARPAIADVLPGVLDKVMASIARQAKDWTPYTRDVSASRASYWDLALEGQTKYGKKSASELYTKEELGDLQSLIDDLPDNVDPELALERLWGGNDIDQAYLGDMGSKIKPNAIWYDEPKMMDAYNAASDLSQREMELWRMTGIPPKSFPKESIPYMDRQWLIEFSPAHFDMDGHPIEKFAQFETTDRSYVKALERRKIQLKDMK